MTTLGELFGAALVVPDAIDASRASDIRARCEGRYTRYALYDRGSYDVLHDLDAPELVAIATRAAEQATGRQLVLVEARVLRLVPGDYVLAHHDRIHAGNPVEVMIDLSAAAVPDAEVHFRRRGGVFLRFASAPGALAIVERGPTITCNHTYVSKLHERACIVRAVLLLRDVTAARGG